MTTDEAFMASLSQLCERTLGRDLFGSPRDIKVYIKQVDREICQFSPLGRYASVDYTVRFVLDSESVHPRRSNQPAYDFDSDAEEVVDAQQIGSERKRLMP